MSRRKASTELLSRVATIYRNAGLSGEPPTKAVARDLRMTYSTAAKWVMRSRAAGLLPKTLPGLGTHPRHAPATAIVGLHSTSEQRWQVCRTCLVGWPCPDWRRGDD